MAAVPTPIVKATAKTEVGRDVVLSARSRELFIAVVGPAGAGASRVINSMQRVCLSAGYACEVIKASQVIRNWASENASTTIPSGPSFDNVRSLQDFGDLMREKDPSAVARAMMREVVARRARALNQTYTPGEMVKPDDKPRAYLLDSIRHPAEIALLRRIYGPSFGLVAVVCEEEERKRRILDKYFLKNEAKRTEVVASVDKMLARDADDPDRPHGQHVTEAFFEADFFVDNSVADDDDTKHHLDDHCGRLLDIITHSKIVRPTIEETAMHHAHSARVRSACMSRQVGAALVAEDGTVVSTGANEVPAAGGGVYGEKGGAVNRLLDDRCIFRDHDRFCSSNREQNRIVEELIASIPALKAVKDQQGLAKQIRATSLGGLLEFSRAVHAEMDALLSAGREGVSTVGTRLFVTTFPCHYCARHIVSAGVYEVQYIEPYPKSLATKLHRDAIEVDSSKWNPPKRYGVADDLAIAKEEAEGKEQKKPGKVLFRPFVGVAPRIYLRAFEKTRRLKDKVTGDYMPQDPEWGDEWTAMTVGYPELEAALTK